MLLKHKMKGIKETLNAVYIYVVSRDPPAGSSGPNGTFHAILEQFLAFLVVPRQ